MEIETFDHEEVDMSETNRKGSFFKNNPNYKIVKHFKFTRSQITRMPFDKRLALYTTFVHDEMSPIMFRGYGKANQIHMILEGSYDAIEKDKDSIVFGAEKWMIDAPSLIHKWMEKHEIPM